LIELTEIHQGLFKDPDYNILKTDDFWKLPTNILKHFENLDKSIHEVVYVNYHRAKDSAASCFIPLSIESKSTGSSPRSAGVE
jgi:hypothetical protein